VTTDTATLIQASRLNPSSVQELLGQIDGLSSQILYRIFPQGIKLRYCAVSTEIGSVIEFKDIQNCTMLTLQDDREEENGPI
jgi:hypothetical protein